MVFATYVYYVGTLIALGTLVIRRPLPPSLPSFAFQVRRAILTDFSRAFFC